MIFTNYTISGFIGHGGLSLMARRNYWQCRSHRQMLLSHRHACCYHGNHHSHLSGTKVQGTRCVLPFALWLYYLTTTVRCMMYLFPSNHMTFVRILILSTKRRNVIARYHRISEYAISQKCHPHHDYHLFCSTPCNNHWTLKVGTPWIRNRILRNCG